jgi:NADPH:quinone reductase-like Zn-dependent oxidoreductase
MRGWITDPGSEGGLRLAEDLPEPQPAPNEAVIAVKAYSINRGELGLITRRPDGFRPGQDVAGVVVQQAVDGGPAVGTRVGGIVDWHGWAERVAVPMNFLAPLPDNVSFEQAATLPVAGLTALRALRLGGSIVGRRVLITGATGGVGQFAIQIALAAGAHVTAIVSSEGRFDEARQLGAHEVMTTLEGADVAPFHLVLEGVGGANLAQDLHNVAPGALIVLYSGAGGPSTIGLGDFQRKPGVRITGIALDNPPDAPIGDELGEMASMIAAGSLKPLIGLNLDWLQTREVIAAMAARQVRGKAVLSIP